MITWATSIKVLHSSCAACCPHDAHKLIEPSTGYQENDSSQMSIRLREALTTRSHHPQSSKIISIPTRIARFLGVLCGRILSAITITWIIMRARWLRGSYVHALPLFDTFSFRTYWHASAYLVVTVFVMLIPSIPPISRLILLSFVRSYVKAEAVVIFGREAEYLART